MTGTLMGIEEADYNIRVAVAIRLLYENLKIIEFDSEYDNSIRDQVLDRVRELVGFDPMDIELLTGDETPEQYSQN